MAEEKLANEAEGNTPVAVPEESSDEVAQESEARAAADSQIESTEGEAAFEEPTEGDPVPDEPAKKERRSIKDRLPWKMSGAASAQTTEGEQSFEGTTEGDPVPDEPAKKKKRRFRDRPHWKATLAVIIVVVVGAFGAFWVWHNTPGFCDAICHNPQDPYNPTYYATPGDSAVDKWGNEVKDASSMLAATHREYGDLVCIDCHVPVLSQQIGEGFNWLIGNFYNPLSERSVENLAAARNMTGEEFCLNESCHNMSKSDLTAATIVYSRNPHQWHHFEYTCSDCHKSHRASIMVCTECHDDAETPDGWLTVEQARNLDTIYAPYDTESYGN